MEQLGKDFNCAPHVIHRVLKELDIPIRDKHTAKIGVQKVKLIIIGKVV